MNKKKICIGIIVFLTFFNIICFSIVIINKSQKQVSESIEDFIFDDNYSDIESFENINNVLVTDEEIEVSVDENSKIEDFSLEATTEISINSSLEEDSKNNGQNTPKPQVSTSQKNETPVVNTKILNQNTKEEKTSITQQENTQINNSETKKEEIKNEETKIEESKKEETKIEDTKKIDLSKYDYYENGLNGTYKGFIKDTAEIEKLKSLINTCIKENDYKNVKVKSQGDSSLARSNLRYFTANKTNVNNAINDCDGFTISYYAVKEFHISANGTETFFQTRSYIKVK